jgi:long-chain acyl-CoA synthetase
MLDLAERPPVVPRPWTRQYDPGVPAALDYPAVRLDELLRRTAQRYPALTALDFVGRRTTYRALDEAVDRIAIGLRRLGLEPGERIALFLPNCPQLVIGFQAIWRAGCVVVPTNPRATVPEFVRQLADAGASAAFVAEPARLLGVADIPPSVRHLIAADPIDDLPLPLRIVARLRKVAGMRDASRRDASSWGDAPRQGDVPMPGAPRVTAFRALLRDGVGDRVASTVGPDDPAALLYTGGTTGLPKAAVLTHRSLVANACQLGAWARGLDDGAEVMLSALPLVHGYAMTACMNVAVLRGWTQVLVPDPRDVDRLLAAIERTRVTVFPGVPTLYAAICGHPTVTSGRRDLHSIEACISGAATLPSGVQREFERLTDGRVVEGYGLTEASPATHCNPLGGRGRSGSIGLPLPDTDCRLVDVETEATPVEPGRPGVLCVRGPQVMAGYWQRPQETTQVLRRDDDGRTWLHTGDVAVMDDDGYFRIVDRKKDVIVAAGGLKVYPNEIEEILSTHPKVRLSAVIGVPVGGADQRAKAFVVLREGERADETEILAFLAARVAPYKLPKAVEFRVELPLAFTGKVLRRVLADEERRAAVPAERAERPRRRARAQDG